MSELFETSSAQYPSRWLKVLLKSCRCGVLADEQCDCLEFARQFEESPVVVFTAGRWQVTR